MYTYVQLLQRSRLSKCNEYSPRFFLQVNFSVQSPNHLYTNSHIQIYIHVQGPSVCISLRLRNIFHAQTTGSLVHVTKTEGLRVLRVQVVVKILHRLHRERTRIPDNSRRIGAASGRVRNARLRSLLPHQVPPPLRPGVLEPHLQPKRASHKSCPVKETGVRRTLTCSTLLESPVFWASCFRSLASGFWLMAK